MTTLKTLLLSLAAATAFGSLVFAVDSTAPSTSTASTPGDASTPRIERLMRFAAHRLDLTEAQVAAVKDVYRMHQPELQPLLERSRREREELRSIVAAKELDEAALEAHAAKIGETAKALTIVQARLRADLRAILTPAQVDKLMHARRQMAERRRHGREAFGHEFERP